MLKRVVHLTSVHPRYDTRIYVKMCSSLADVGYSVYMVVADGKGNELINDISIIDVGLSQGGRLFRMTRTVTKVYEKAKELDADLYHLHDPELLPLALKLKKLGKVVVFDAHEDFPLQLLSKPYLNAFIAKVLSKIAALYEGYSCKRLDAIVTATPYIAKKFLEINKKSIDINNYPVIGEFSEVKDWSEKQDTVCYVGGITKARGIHELVRSMEILTRDVTLTLAGRFQESITERQVKSYQGWKKVNALGWLDRDGINSVLLTSVAGLVTLHPTINYRDALPVKMFEYMSAGIPIIASDIILWKQIIDTADCGICVDPLNPADIANAIDFLISNPIEAQRMGKNGRNAVIREYNWSVEEAKLIALYEGLLR